MNPDASSCNEYTDWFHVKALGYYDFFCSLVNPLFSPLLSPYTRCLVACLYTYTMPSVLSNSPFLSLRQDPACGRHVDHSPHTNGSSQPFSIHQSTVGHTTNNYANGSPIDSKDEFLKLSTPQQDVLLLHGPRQRYSLEKAQDIPELKSEREILIQVLAIGLNPVDWKGADFGKFGRRGQYACQRTSYSYIVLP